MIQVVENIINEHYDLGIVVHLEQLQAGYCNLSFYLRARNDSRELKYLVRGYNPAASEMEIKFEHALISHLKGNGFAMAAGIVPTKYGRTYIGEDRAAVRYWAVFEFLEGEDRYRWTDTHLSTEEMASASKALADLHRAGYDFDPPPGSYRIQPRIMDFLPTFRSVYDGHLQNPGDSDFGRCFVDHCNDILTFVDQTRIPEYDLKNMPQVPIHCDFHPGNLKYEDLHVVGVFDFDWSKIDLRLFDLALAMVYFCTCRDGRMSGSLVPEKLKLFLASYNKNCPLTAGPGPLTNDEKAYLPVMLAAANLFVLHWTIVDFYSDNETETNTYLDYFNHGIKLMRWIEDQKDFLLELSSSAPG